MERGRPSAYTEDTLRLTQEYINKCVDTRYNKRLKVKLPTIEGLALYLKVHKDTIYTWRKEKKDFSDLIEQLLAKQADALISNGLSGDYNPTIAKVLLAKHGYAERQEIMHEIPKGFLNINPLNDPTDNSPKEDSPAT